MKLSDIGEFALIERLAAIIGPIRQSDVIVGIGDDAAVWRSGDEFIIATTDTMVEGVHFLSGTPWEDVGWKAVAVNISDIAAMGGTPQFALVTLALPPDTDVASIAKLYEGLSECTREFGVTIVGGDTVRASEVSITVAVIGVAQQQKGQPMLLRRDAARASDFIAVSGSLGGSAAGLRLLQRGADPNDPLVRRHLRPGPRIEAGRLAVQMGLACGIDVSDGLLQDIGHICEASSLGAVIEAAEMPVNEAVTEAFPGEGVELACTGGEDYELVFVAQEDRIKHFIKAMETLPVTIIGQMVDDPEHRVRLLDDTGHEISFEHRGWDAFR